MLQFPVHCMCTDEFSYSPRMTVTFIFSCLGLLIVHIHYFRIIYYSGNRILYFMYFLLCRAIEPTMSNFLAFLKFMDLNEMICLVHTCAWSTNIIVSFTSTQVPELADEAEFRHILHYLRVATESTSTEPSLSSDLTVCNVIVLLIVLSLVTVTVFIMPIWLFGRWYYSQNDGTGTGGNFFCFCEWFRAVEVSWTSCDQPHSS